MKVKKVSLILVSILAVACLSGCNSTNPTSQNNTTLQSNASAPKPTSKEQKALDAMQDFSSADELFRQCPDEKLRKQYEALSEKAGKLTVNMQCGNLSKKEMKKASKKMEKYQKEYEKLLEKLNALEGKTTTAPTADN